MTERLGELQHGLFNMVKPYIRVESIISVASILVPALAVFMVIVVLAFVFRIYRKLRPRRGRT